MLTSIQKYMQITKFLQATTISAYYKYMDNLRNNYIHNICKVQTNKQKAVKHFLTTKCL